MDISTIPAISIHMEVSVGVPVKNLEKLDAKESMALRPRTTKATPAMRKIKDMRVFMTTCPRDGAAKRCSTFKDET